MKKLIWLAFLLPLNAFANPFTVNFCLANPNDDTCIGFNLDRDRLDALQQQIDQEAQDRIAADDDLQQQIDGLQDSGGTEPLLVGPATTLRSGEAIADFAARDCRE